MSSKSKIKHTSREKGAIGMLLIASFLWGSSFVGSKICLNAGMLQFETVFYRFVIGVGLMWVFFHRQLRSITPKAWSTGMMLGLISSAIYALEMFAITYTETSKAAFLTSTNIVLMPFLCALFFKTSVRLTSIGASLLAMVGVGFLSLTSQFTLAPGDAMLLAASLCYALNSIVITKFGGDAPRAQITFVQLLVIMVFSGIMTLIQGHGSSYGLSAWAAVLFLAVGPTTICFFLKNYALQFVSPVRCSLILSTEGVFCAILSMVLFGERITGKMLIGVLLIFSGILLEEVKKR